MNDDLLTTFRFEMPLPDEATTQRIYQRATSGRRHLVTRRRLVAGVAVLAAAGIAGGVSATLGGGGGQPAVTHPSGPHGGGPREGGPPARGVGETGLNPLTVDFTASNHEVTSIDLTIRSQTPATTLDVKVVRSDSSQVPDANNAPNEVVFDEHVSPTVVESSMQDATQSTWSGTLSPSDWNGGCENALYRIHYAFGNGGTGDSGWFQCSGPAADPANPFPNHFPG